MATADENLAKTVPKDFGKMPKNYDFSTKCKLQFFIDLFVKF